MDIESLRLAVYESFGQTGTAPDPGSLAATFGTTIDDVELALRQLADGRHLVLSSTGAILMAHPFSSVPLGFSVMGSETLWWGGCSWDSFAIPHLLKTTDEVLVATRCPACQRPHAWSVGTVKPPTGTEVAHFLVPSPHMWDNVLHTCANQRIFCSVNCVHSWLADSGQGEGFIMDLPTLWSLAAHWYDGRMDPGYVRREPSEAQDYLRSIGLSGRFWGT